MQAVVEKQNVMVAVVKFSQGSPHQTLYFSN